MKLCLSSDLHFGNKGNSTQHNEDLLEFIVFMIAYCKKNKITQLVLLGDYFHQRDKLDVNSINYAIAGINILNDHFGKFKMIKGNHDLYFKDSRDVCSLEMFRDKIELIDNYLIQDNLMFVSWVNSEEEYDNIINISKKNKIRFMFGHYEFAAFKMNDNYEMQHGQSHKELKHIEKVFTGHYHMRQQKDNIEYIGSPFPFDFNDANDTNRGFTVLDTETGETDFLKYDKISIVSVTHEEFLNTEWKNTKNTSIRVIIDEVIDDETTEKIKQKLESGEFRCTKVVYKTTREENALLEETEINEIMTIDEMVVSHLTNMSNIEGIDKNLLINLYKETQDEDI